MNMVFCNCINHVMDVRLEIDKSLVNLITSLTDSNNCEKNLTIIIEFGTFLEFIEIR